MKNFIDRHFDKINNCLVLLITAVVLYPLIYVVSASISDPVAVNTGKMWLWPVNITFDGFRRVFQNPQIWRGYRNTIFYTVVGTMMSLCVLIPCAYALSRREVKGKKLINFFIVFTMMFSGGMIPTYLLIDRLGMLNTIWVMLIPGIVSAWNILVSRSFFQTSIPVQLLESATVDGASEWTIFLKIVLPLSMPIIAVMALFRGVGLWNEYFSALVYIRNEELYPLQLILRQILVLNQVTADSLQNNNLTGQASSIADLVNLASLIRYAVMIVSAVPLLIAYPFVQKFFVKGVLIGSVKE